MRELSWRNSIAFPLTRITKSYRIFLHIMPYHAFCSNHAQCSNLYSPSYIDIATNKATIAYTYRMIRTFEISGFHIVPFCYDMHVISNSHVISHIYFSLQVALFIYRNTIAQMELPRQMHVSRRSDETPLSYLSAKSTQAKDSPFAKKLRCCGIKIFLNKKPDMAFNLFSFFYSIWIGQIKLFFPPPPN